MHSIGIVLAWSIHCTYSDCVVGTWFLDFGIIVQSLFCSASMLMEFSVITIRYIVIINLPTEDFNLERCHKRSVRSCSSVLYMETLCSKLLD